MRQWAKLGIGLLSASMLAACDPPQLSPRPEPRETVAPTKASSTPSARSVELAQYYAGVQASLLRDDLLRTDGGGADTPFAKRNLVENFIQIGAFTEFALSDGRYKPGRTADRIKRWEKPVQIALHFGDAVSEDIRAKDRKTVADYARRLSRVTGNRVSTGFGRGNFHVAVLTVDEIENYAPELRRLIPSISPEIAAQITDMARPVYCAVYTYSKAETPDTIETAVAIIRAEHPDLMRKSCYHEEIAQGLGLSNDSPAARPSIFNDDNEFALLTRHDELLLEILYDKRLPLGATPTEARPVVEVIASELLGGAS